MSDDQHNDVHEGRERTPADLYRRLRKAVDSADPAELLYELDSMRIRDLPTDRIQRLLDLNVFDIHTANAARRLLNERAQASKTALAE